MSLEAMKQHGAFSWNELVTTDLAAAKTFYGELLGWTLQDMDMGDMTYTMIKVGDREVGGMMAIPAASQGRPAAWGCYVTVDNVDSRVAHAKTLGAKIHLPPQDIPNVGRFAVIADPQGAMLALITYSKKD